MELKVISSPQVRRLESTSAQKLNGTPEQKLLKTGKQYSLGRRDRDLVVNNKKISHDHLKLIIGELDIVRTQPITRVSISYET